MSDYEPKFEREGTTRRVLGHISDEDHLGRGPRNTLDRLVQELTEDPHTTYAGDVGDMREFLQALLETGLIAQRQDGTYVVTGSGRYELTH